MNTRWSGAARRADGDVAPEIAASAATVPAMTAERTHLTWRHANTRIDRGKNFWGCGLQHALNITVRSASRANTSAGLRSRRRAEARRLLERSSPPTTASFLLAPRLPTPSPHNLGLQCDDAATLLLAVLSFILFGVCPRPAVIAIVSPSFQLNYDATGIRSPNARAMSTTRTNRRKRGQPAPDPHARHASETGANCARCC
jgi:hypothetical protein